MRKTKHKFLKELITFFLLLILVTLFIPIIKTEDFSVNGFQAILGYKPSYEIGIFSASVQFTFFSWPILVTYLLALIGLVILLTPIKSKNMIKYLMIATINIITLILFIYIIEFFKNAVVNNNFLIELYFNSLIFNYSIGAYLGIIASAINIFLSGLMLFIKSISISTTLA